MQRLYHSAPPQTAVSAARQSSWLFSGKTQLQLRFQVANSRLTLPFSVEVDGGDGRDGEEVWNRGRNSGLKARRYNPGSNADGHYDDDAS